MPSAAGWEQNPTRRLMAMKPEEMRKEAASEVKRELGAAHAPPLDVIEMPATLTDRLLMQVRQQRRRDDEREGFMRDYPDGVRGRRFKGPTLEQDVEAPVESLSRLREAMRSANPSWRHHLEHRLALVNAAESESELEQHLLGLSAIAVAWAEAIEMRADRRRIDAEAAKHRKLRVVALEGGGQMVLRDMEPPAASSSRETWMRRLLNWFRRT